MKVEKKFFWEGSVVELSELSSACKIYSSVSNDYILITDLDDNVLFRIEIYPLSGEGGGGLFRIQRYQ
jgi:hypothetical protein